MAGTAHLVKFGQTFYKNNNASDVRQIPADGAIVTVYRQGATVASSVTVTTAGAGVAVSVRSIGMMAAGDTVQLGTDATKTMLVVEITNSFSAKLRSTTGSNISATVGSRIVITNTKPTLYTESTADLKQYGGATTSNPVATDSKGYAEFYTQATRFDLIVSGSGITDYLVIDSVGGWMRGGVHWVNVRDFSTFQAAVDAMPEDGVDPVYGGTLYIPPGRYHWNTNPKFEGIVVNRAMTIQGDSSATTIIHHFPAGAENVHMIDITAPGRVYIKGLQLQGPATAGTGCAINRYKAASNMQEMFLEDLNVLESASWGFKSQPDVGYYTSKIYMKDCAFYAASSGGNILIGANGDGGTNNIVFENCEFDGPGFGTYGTGPMDRGAVHFEHTSMVRFTNCQFQGAGTSPSLSFDGLCSGIQLTNTYAERNSGTKHFITTSGGMIGLQVSNLSMTNNASGDIPKVLKTSTNGPLYGVFSSFYCGHKESVYSTDDFVLDNAGDSLSLVNGLRQHLESGILTEFSVTDRAGVAFFNAAQGFAQMKLPGVSSTAVITRPVDGTMIYDTTANKMKFYNGTAWETVTSA